MKYEISVSPDKMSAMITLRDDGVRYQVTESEIMEALRRSGVKYGIIYKNLKKLIESPAFDVPILIAKGRPPIDGQDGRVEITVKKRKNSRESKRGRVDLKEFASRERIIVKKGDVIGKLIKPTKGIPGANVFGEKLNPKPGKPAKIRIGDGIKIEKDGTLVATKSGQLVLEGESIYISDTLIIKGDVDYSVGNIEFPGSVEISGDVKPGFVVRATGTIKVKGIVEAATVISYESNVELTGVKGREKGMIKAGKDVIAKFLESTHVEAGRDVEVDGPITNCVVKAKNKVLSSGKKGVIVGGMVLAGKEIEAEDIGSEIGVKTVIEIGVDPSLKEEEKILSAQIQLDEENLQKLLNILGDLKKLRDANGGELPEDKKEVFSKVTQTIIHLKNSIDTNTKRLMEIRKKIEISKKGTQIIVKRILYPGTEITMFQRTISIDRMLRSVVLVYDEKREQIVVRSYKV